MADSKWWPLIWSHLSATSVPVIFFIQRVIVAIYTLVIFLSRLRHKKWIVLILVSLYIVLRATGRTPVVGKARKIHINQVITTTTYDPDLMKPTQVDSFWTDETFECIGWKRSHTCFKPPTVNNPQAFINPPKEKDFLNCSEHIEKEMAGYCIVRNRTSGDLFKLMVSTCDSLANGFYTCDMARNFSEYALYSVGYEHQPLAPNLALPSLATKRKPKNGILMIVYDKVLPSTYAVIRMLRLHQCTLPIEIWYRPDEMSIDNPILHKLLLDYNVVIRPIFDRRATGFHVKPYAVYYSNFENILLLDADNIPMKDPTYLFEEPEFISTGALFWPDYWQPSNSLFQLTNASLVWQMTGVKYIDQYEQESGQVLINRVKSKRALDKLMFYSTHSPRLLEELHLIWGDKDLFRLAWLNTSQPFHYIRFPPAVGGLDLKDKGIFCGLAMLQHDVQGNLIFFHRNSIKLDGTFNQPRIMTHIQEYALDGNPQDYRIFQAVYAHKECCYYIGNQVLRDGQPATQVTPIEATTYASLEELAIQFSIEGRNLLLAEEHKLQRSLPLAVPPKRGKKEKKISWLTRCRTWMIMYWKSLRIQDGLAVSIFVYVFSIVFVVWCRARPARDRLPSRWDTLELKQN